MGLLKDIFSKPYIVKDKNGNIIFRGDFILKEPKQETAHKGEEPEKTELPPTASADSDEPARE